MRLIFKLIVLLSAICFLTSCGSRPSSKKMPVAEVEIAPPLKKKIIEWHEYTGRFQAIHEVDIRSRVTGYLNAIQFKDGQLVRKGDILFIIDPRPFQYALAGAQARYDLAQKQYERASKLKKESFISQEVIDQRLQEMKVAETTLSDAKLNLEFTEIKSPIAGRISRYFVSIGNLIRKDNTVLTKVVSTNPIYFYFEMSQGDLLKYIRLNKMGQHLNLQNISPRKILIKLQDEKNFTYQGTMDFTDNIVDQSTGTILGRATVMNPKGVIYPGLFGRARLAGSDEYEALLLPDKAINTDQTRKFVYAVDDKNQIYRIYIELGSLRDNGFYVIHHGLKGNESIVINGIQLIHRTGQKIKPHSISLQE
jgi:RND family efflux transporter MFP subunit